MKCVPKFKVGDLVMTTDCISDATQHGRHREDDEQEEALAIVLRTSSCKDQPRYKLSSDEFEVCYTSGPCSGDCVREATCNFKLVSRRVSR